MVKRKTVIGTPFWMAPEVIVGGSYDRSADIWSLGILLYELCNGDPPHANEHALRALFIIPNSPPPRLVDDTENDYVWSDEAKDFMAQCCQMDPSKRPTAKELLQHPFICNIVNPESVLLPLVEKTRDLMDLIRSMDTSTDIQAQQGSDGCADTEVADSPAPGEQQSSTYSEHLLQRANEITSTLQNRFGHDRVETLRKQLASIGDESQRTIRIQRTLARTLKRNK
uniref:Serine/threonine-protein kinase 3 n=1 Tax=Lygus hesperus TaxID=30085 RepID=A0A0A9WA92_LYGHE